MTTNADITPEELKERLAAGEDLLIIDVRSEDDYADWHINSNSNAEMTNIPYASFQADERSITDRLSGAREAVVVCARGRTSVKVVNKLREAGHVHVQSLMGGMRAWGELYDVREVPQARAESAPFRMWQVIRRAKGCLSYVIASDGEAMVVDAGRRLDPYVTLAQTHDLKIKYVMDTHLHADHISGGRALAAQTGATYLFPAGDADEVSFPFTPLRDSDVLKVGRAPIEVTGVHTPGHTPGSTSLLIDGRLLLTGDTLFVQSAGRPDLGGMAESWVHSLYESLFTTLRALDPAVRIYPAHFGNPEEFDEDGTVSATLGDLRRENRVLQLDTKESFVRHILDRISQQPSNFEEIRLVNKGATEVSVQEAAEMETGPNRCAV